MDRCTFCKTADEKLGEFIRSKEEIETSFSRQPKQALKCGFGMKGVCCRLCANGPCRITPKSPRGVCGADSDTIVARNFLRAVAAGAACYLHVVENAAENMKAAGQGKTSLNIKGYSALNRLAEKLGIHSAAMADSDVAIATAVKIAERVLKDLYKPRQEKMDLVMPMSLRKRYEKWSKLGILPGGAKSEVFDAIVKSSTNLSSDPQDMLMHALKLGIATGVYGLTLTNMLNDILLGEPKLQNTSVGFRVIDPDYINIMPTGHQQSLFEALLERLGDDDVIKKAQKVGAKGIKLIGCTCVGQDFQLRGNNAGDKFAGHAGNNFTSEAVLATGAIDLLVSEFNCTIPGLEYIANEFMIDQVCIDDVAKKKNAEMVQYSPEKAREIADLIINRAIGSYINRRDKVEIDVPYDHGYDDVLAGVSETSLKNFLGGSYKPLIDLIATGKIKGIAGVVGCSNLSAKGHDVFTVELAKELIKKDILVLTAGCTSGGLENCGFMTKDAAKMAGNSLREVCEELGIPPVLNFGPCLAIGRLEMVASELAQALDIDLPQLPLVLSAPQWLEEQALADGAYGLALGLPLHLAIPPFITGSELVTKVLTEDLPSVTGGQLILDGNVNSTADKLESIIMNRRKGLGL